MADSTSSAFQALMTALSSIGAGFSAWAAWKAVKVSQETAQEGAESNRIAEENRLSAFRPHVVVYTRIAEFNGTPTHTIALFISNVGPGAARQISFSVIRGGDVRIFDRELITDWGPIKSGISVLASGESIRTNLINRHSSDWDDLKDKEVLIEVKYSNIEGKSYSPERFFIDLNVGENTSWTSNRSDDPDMLRNRALENINQAIRKLQR